MKTHQNHSRLSKPERPKYRGFTLVEILVVISIIVILAAVGFSMVGRMRIQAQSAVCMGNLKQLGTAMLSYSADHNNQVIPLKVTNEDGSNGGIWPVVLARAGYLWDPSNPGPLPCGRGVWTCPECDYMSDTYGGYGLIEGISKPSANVPQGQLRISSIPRLSQTWLVGDAMRAKDPKKGWYALRTSNNRWEGGGGPAVGRHGSSRVNVCMYDGHLESLTMKEIIDGKYTTLSDGTR